MQEGKFALDNGDCEKAMEFINEGLNVKAAGDKLNHILYCERGYCQRRRLHCAHAVLDAAVAASFDPSDPSCLLNSGRAWEIMGVYSAKCLRVHLFRL